MKRRGRMAVVLFNISRLFSFFCVISLVVTIAMLAFLDGVELDLAALPVHAKRAFRVIVVMTVAGCGIDALRRHLTVQKPLNQILEALDRITKGDFSVRLAGQYRTAKYDGFQEINHGINRLAQELSGVETLRSDFIANVSHEMKTPLAAVQNYAMLLRDPGLPPEKQQEYAAAIVQTTRRLSELVSNVLKLNKLENQQIYPEARTFDLGENLAQCLLEFEAAWEEKRLVLDCSLADGIQVEADPELLRLVWTNLISNAVKFTPVGGSISVSLQAEGPWATVCVADTGCGMGPETGAHIFEKFYQGDTAHATQGNGLGLALVKRVVDITGGNIAVSSTLGKGSAFTVQVRRAADGAD